MEVGIRKGAWRRAWRYPAYLWSLRWVYAVKKNPRGWYMAYTPQYTHCSVRFHDMIRAAWCFTYGVPSGVGMVNGMSHPEVFILRLYLTLFADKHVTESSSTEWKQDWQPRRSLLCSSTASQCCFGVTRPWWSRPRQYSIVLYFLLVCFSAWYSAPGRGSRVSWWVYLCVCLSTSISLELHIRSSPNFLCMLPSSGCRLVLLWQHCDMLFTSGFMDDRLFAHSAPTTTLYVLCGLQEGVRLYLPW